VTLLDPAGGGSWGGTYLSSRFVANRSRRLVRVDERPGDARVLGRLDDGFDCLWNTNGVKTSTTP
jgi:hypothetical protein